MSDPQYIMFCMDFEYILYMMKGFHNNHYSVQFLQLSEADSHD